jgi:hypothetical protein
MQQVQLPEHACCECTHPAGRTMTNAPGGAAAAELEATSDAVLQDLTPSCSQCDADVIQQPSNQHLDITYITNRTHQQHTP